MASYKVNGPLDFSKSILLMMINKKLKARSKKSQFLLSVFFAAIVCVSLVAAQNVVPVRDLTGGTNVFIFRGGTKSVSQRFVTQARSKRTTSQRAQSARNVNRQYTSLAKANPRRQRSETVDPNRVKIDLKVMPADEASRLFAGVGEYYVDRSEYDSAIDFFRDSLNLQATNERARQGLSEVLALKGNELLAQESQAVAKKFFEEALSINPKNAPAYFGLAEIQSDSGEESEAVANYEKALEADGDLTEIYVPLGILYYQQGNFAKADEFLTKSVKIDDKNAVSQQFLGLVRLQQGRNVDAQQAFSLSKTLDQTNAKAFYYSGESLTRLDRNKDAVKDFQKAIDLDPKYFEAWYGLGTALFELENYGEAVKALEEAKKLRNDNAEVVANLGDAYRQIEDPALANNKYSLAESNYNLAVLFFERRPDFATNVAIRELTADIYNRIAFSIAKQCEINMRRAVACKWNVAVRALEKSSQISKDTVDLANLGWAYYNAGKSDIIENKTAEGRIKLEKARASLLQAVGSSSEYREGALLNLGMVYTDLGDHKGAIKTLSDVVAREPNWVFALNELGIAYFNDGNFKEATTQFKRAVGRDDKFAEAYYNLGRSEFKNGKINEVKKAHTKLRSLGRNDLAAKLASLTGGLVRN
ncbi:hypothetical protein BH24ACI3_BH24ACI3_03160 [soil metagenome]